MIQNSNWNSSLAKLIKYLYPERLKLMGAFIALCLTSGGMLALGKGLQYLIDYGISKGDLFLLNKIFMIMIILIIILAMATYCRTRLINMVAENIVYRIRNEIYAHIINIAPHYFEDHKVGDVVSRISNDVNLIGSIISTNISYSIRNLIILFGSIFFLFSTSIKLAIYLLILLPIIMVPILTIGKKVRAKSKLNQEATANLAARIEESLNGIKIVQAFNRQNFEIDCFNQQAKLVLDSSKSWSNIRSLFVASVLLIIFLSITAVLWIGGQDVINSKISGGLLSSFIFYAILLATSTGALSEAITELQRALAAIDRVFELFQIKIISQNFNSITKLSFDDSLCFHNISFSYPTRVNSKVIDNFSLTIQRGQTIAIVGPSGSGKTTLLQLLLRFYQPTVGNITIDDQDIEQLKLTDLRELFGLVSQDAVIFSGTVLENIKYGNPQATNKQIVEAAKAAEIYDFFEQFPAGLDSFIGEKGLKLSGGERQRIAIARAIIKNAPILLLDEATSNLDNNNEKLVQEALNRLKANRTIIIIAHRLSTITKADQIIVLEDGKIVEIGNHQELINNKDLYWRLISA